MKRIVTTFLMAVALMAPTMTQADNLTADQAREAAAYYMRCNTTLSRLTADQLTLSRQWNNDELGVPSMYLFTTTQNAWIIMAASTVAHPIVGFSDESDIDADNLPVQLEGFLAQHNEWICYVQNEDATRSLTDSPMWTKIVNQKLTVNTKASEILLSTRWDQGDENGTSYNMYSPQILGEYCYTGCVATALAQICKYYEFPKHPVGYKSYTWYYTENGSNKTKFIRLNYADSASLDYSLMKNKISAATPLESRREISRLNYYVGVAVEMQFGTYYNGGGSGTTSNLVANNMSRFFKYQTGTYVLRHSVRDTAFLNSVKRELDMNRPLYMSGSSSIDDGGRDAAGHAWVCDGYKVNGDDTTYHMNWGWNGSGNAFFDLGANNMYIEGQNLNFNGERDGVFQTIITGMIPPRDSTDRDVFVGIADVEDNTTLGSAYPNPATLNVVLPYSSERAADLMVYSVDGRLVHSERVQAGTGEVTLGVSGMPAGIYIYRMGSAHGKFVVR